MTPPPAYHIGYADGASRWTQNLASAAWALYTPSHELLHSGGICLGPATNNQAEYTAVIGLLTDAQHHHIRHLSVLPRLTVSRSPAQQCLPCTRSVPLSQIPAG
jgi:hypothetical protein